ncbi:hypothetical protein IC575_013940 [Cucumis melo]
MYLCCWVRNNQIVPDFVIVFCWCTVLIRMCASNLESSSKDKVLQKSFGAMKSYLRQFIDVSTFL